MIDHPAAGTYRVRAQRDGYRAWEREVPVAADARVEVVIELER